MGDKKFSEQRDIEQMQKTQEQEKKEQISLKPPTIPITKGYVAPPTTMISGKGPERLTKYEDLTKKYRKAFEDRQSVFRKPPQSFPDLVNKFYKESNYPTKVEIAIANKKYGISAKDQDIFKPKTVGEALNRLAYASTEMIQGGVTEATLGLAYDKTSKDRHLSTPLQIAGGIATPTPLDYAVGAVLTKLGVTKAGRKIVNKIADKIDEVVNRPTAKEIKFLLELEKTKGVDGFSTAERRTVAKGLKYVDWERIYPFVRDLTPEDLRNIERIKGTSGFSTYDIRRAKNTVNKVLKLPNLWADLDEPVKLTFTPSELRQIEKVVGNSGISTDDLRNKVLPRSTGLTTEELRTLSPNTLRKLMLEAERQTRDIGKYTSGAAWIQDETRLYNDIMDLYGWDDEAFTDFLATYGDKLKIDPSILTSVLFRVPVDEAYKVIKKAGNIEIDPEYLDTVLRQIQEAQEKKGLPVDISKTDVIVKDTTDTTQDEKQEPIEKDDIIPVPPIIPPPPPPPIPPDEPDDTPEPTPPEKLAKLRIPEVKEKRREINLRLYYGSRKRYRVRFIFERGTETQLVEARSYLEALNKAQRQRPTVRQRLRMIDMEALK